MNLNDAFPLQQTCYTRGYTTNNIYNGVPPLMMDGRSVIASYQPEAWLNESLLKESGVKSNYEYRQYLVNNAKDIMRRNFEESANDCGYYVNSNQAPPARVRDTSDLKQLYMSREELNSRVAGEP